MKTVFHIAYAELRMLFYSPIAWLLLCLFTFQSGMAFCDALGRLLETREMGVEHQQFQTYILMIDGVFSAIMGNLLWYIPLLTMGLMSREYNLGSVKLLYSSPIGCEKIIWGKYLAMMVFGVVLLAVLVLLGVCGACWVKDFDIPWVISGIAGIYLLYCTYAAIGLFMSSLTPYQIVAAIGTLLVLTVLNYLQGVGQDIDFVREITWWLALSGRSGNFVQGLIGLEDVVYFVVVIVLFVVLTILKLRSERRNDSKVVKVLPFVLVVVVALSVGYLSTRPVLMKYWDVTYIQKNTIPVKAQEFMAELDDEVTFTLYVNLLDRRFKEGMPAFRMKNYAMFKPFIRFKPDIRLNYVYYYDDCDDMRPDLARTDWSVQDKMLKICREEDLDADEFLTPEQIREKLDLSKEGNRLVYVVERENGRKAFLRFFDDNNYVPSEREIATVLKRLVTDVPHVCFLTGHGERSIAHTGDRNYYLLVVRNDRGALSNQGFDFGVRAMTGVGENLEGVDILVIADPQEEYTPEELQKVEAYLAAGGNALVTGEMNSRRILNRLLAGTGVQLDSVFVHQQELPDYAPELIPGEITEISVKQLGLGKDLYKHRGKVVLDGCLALETSDSDFECIPVVEVLGSGEPLVVALRRTVQGKEQRILIAGDADLFSAGEIRRERTGINAGNFSFMTGAFSWLANNEYPLDMTRPEAIDNTLYLSTRMFGVVKIILMWGIPLLIAVVASVVLVRRKRK